MRGVRVIGAVFLALAAAIAAAVAILKLLDGEIGAVVGLVALAVILFRLSMGLQARSDQPFEGAEDDGTAAEPSFDFFGDQRIWSVASGAVAAPFLVLAVGTSVSMKLWVLFLIVFLIGGAVLLARRLRWFGVGWMAGALIHLYSLVAFAQRTGFFNLETRP